MDCSGVREQDRANPRRQVGQVRGQPGHDLHLLDVNLLTVNEHGHDLVWPDRDLRPVDDALGSAC